MNNYIYISIPKTGTNSVHDILGNTDYNHITANIIKKKIGDKAYASKISFCFIRNPIELVKSWYYYHKFSPNVIRQDVKDFYPNNIEDWVFTMNCKTHWEIPIHKKYNPDWNINISPLFQYQWIVDEKEEIIVDKVLLFDNINTELEKMFKVKPKIKNKSNKNDYTLDKRVEDKITELFKKELEYYNNIQV